MASQSPLTFDELRLATLVHKPTHELEFTQAVMHGLDGALLAGALADMVISADKMAAARGIDLAAAIRARFDRMAHK